MRNRTPFVISSAALALGLAACAGEAITDPMGAVDPAASATEVTASHPAPTTFWGNTASTSFTVTVVCGGPQIVTWPGPQAIPAGDDGHAEAPDLTGAVEVALGCGAVTVTQEPAPGTALPIGKTLVAITATDEDGNTDTVEVDVTVTLGVAGFHPPLGAELVPLDEAPPVSSIPIRAERAGLPLKLEMFMGSIPLTGPMVQDFGLPDPAVVAIVDAETGEEIADAESGGGPGAAATGNLFSWTDDHWSYVLDAGDLALRSGRVYAVRVMMSDGAIWHAAFRVR